MGKSRKRQGVLRRNLQLGSGVSMAFKCHCGPILQVEMLRLLNGLDAPLRKGDVVATSSGSAANFTYALHAAIMDYNPGTKRDQKNPTLKTIRIALENIEQYVHWYAKKHQQPVTLVLPLMGCGTGGLDKGDVAVLYRDFFIREIGFECDVVVYGYDRVDFKLLGKILR